MSYSNHVNLHDYYSSFIIILILYVHSIKHLFRSLFSFSSHWATPMHLIRSQLLSETLSTRAPWLNIQTYLWASRHHRRWSDPKSKPLYILDLTLLPSRSYSATHHCSSIVSSWMEPMAVAVSRRQSCSSRRCRSSSDLLIVGFFFWFFGWLWVWVGGFWSWLAWFFLVHWWVLMILPPIGWVMIWLGGDDGGDGSCGSVRERGSEGVNNKKL